MLTNPTLQTEPPPSESQRLGRYKLVTTLGQGGMGAIHLAVMSGMGEFQKLVVVKELRRDLACNAEFVALFLHEAKLAGRLNHPNIVQTLEAGQDGDRYFLSMEFLDGQPFNHIVRAARDEPMVPLRLRLQIIRDALAGLHYAHELRDYDGRSLGIVHCDVSPPNVFVTYDGHVKVVDFGIAKAADAQDNSDAAAFKGKLRYAAPEQILGENIDRRADVFAAGVMLWEAITLRKFASGSVLDQAAIERRLAGTEPKIAAVVPKIPRLLAGICDKALSRDPDHRFATAEDFREALSEYMGAFGAPYDPSAIAHFMSTKFAAERAARHQLIHERIANDQAAVKLRAVSVSPSPLDGEPTAVADLSELVESIRLTDGVIADRRAFRPSMKKVWLPLVAAGALTAIGINVLSSPATEATVSPAMQPLPATAEQTVNGLSAAVKAAEPQTDVNKAVPSSPAATQTSDNERESASEPSEPSEKAKRAKRKRSGKDEKSPAGSAAEEDAPTGVSGSAEAALTSSEAVPGVRAPEQRSTIEVKGVGKDLRAMPKQERRALDVDNPFR